MVGPPLLGGISLVVGLRWSFLIDGIIMAFIAVIALCVAERRSNGGGGLIERGKQEVSEPLLA